MEPLRLSTTHRPLLRGSRVDIHTIAAKAARSHRQDVESLRGNDTSKSAPVLPGLELPPMSPKQLNGVASHRSSIGAGERMRASSTSLLSSRGSFFRTGGAHSSRLHPRLQAEELRRLPPAEAFRQVLIEQAGGLRQAYEKLDVRKTGKVSFDDVEEALGISAPGVCAKFGAKSLAQLFDKVDVERTGVLSLPEILGYVPSDLQKPVTPNETSSQWFQYNNRTSSHPSSMIRWPKWRTFYETGEETDEHGEDVSSPTCVGFDWPAATSAHRERGRFLRQRMREEREAQSSCLKEDMLGNLKDAQVHQRQEKQQGDKRKKRIEGHLRACSKARLELVKMQTELASVSKVDAPAPEKCEFKEMLSLAFNARPVQKSSLEDIAEADAEFLASGYS